MVVSVLLYDKITLVLPPLTFKALEGFHIEAARRLMGIHPRKVKRVWVYPHFTEVLAAAHLQPIQYYTKKATTSYPKSSRAMRF